MRALKQKSERQSERGNVLFYVMFAVALLAALSYAVSQSGRGSITQLNAEKARLLADEILQYGNVLASAAAQLRLRGCKDTEISFENPILTGTHINASAPPDKTCHIFDPAGGGVTYHTFDVSGVTGTPRFQTGNQAITQIGMDNEADLWMHITLDNSESAHMLCAQINDLIELGVENDTSTAAFEPFQNGTWADTDFTGSFPSAGAISNADLDGKTAWCAGHTTDLVSFYRVLIAR